MSFELLYWNSMWLLHHSRSVILKVWTPTRSRPNGNSIWTQPTRYIKNAMGWCNEAYVCYTGNMFLSISINCFFFNIMKFKFLRPINNLSFKVERQQVHIWHNIDKCLTNVWWPHLRNQICQSSLRKPALYLWITNKKPPNIIVKSNSCHPRILNEKFSLKLKMS